jgi:hypothetical protein
MSWAKLADDFHSHPKVLAVGNVGAGLFARSVAYAAHYLTDGFIPTASARMLAGPDQAIVDELVTAGLWDPCPGGYRIHEYLERNPTKATVLARRATEREKKMRQASRRDSPGASRGEARGIPPTPVPVPVPIKDPDARARALQSEGHARAQNRKQTGGFAGGAGESLRHRGLARASPPPRPASEPMRLGDVLAAAMARAP